MTDLLQWGLDFITWIQQYRNPIADAFMRHTTDLGGKYYIYCLPFLLWCLNFNFMVRVCILFLLSFFINVSCKDLLGLPRPFDVDPEITRDREWGHGMPSGHAQNSALLWVMLAISFARRWFWVMALSIVLLIGFSRVYFGLHFPGDILGGWLLAMVMLWANHAWGEKVAQWLHKQSVLFLMGSIWLVFGSLCFLYMWVFNMPIMTGLAALALGVGTGAVITLRFLNYQGYGTLWQRLLRSTLALSVLAFYLKATIGLLPEVRDGEYYQVLFVVNTTAGLWLTLGAPMLFSLLSLAGKGQEER